MHVPFCFRPDVVGGTEIYVEALAREQRARAMDVVVAAPASAAADYLVDELPVRRFGVARLPDLYTLYGDGDETARRGFAALLAEEQPDIVHLHAFTSAVSAGVARDAVAHGAALVFTFHTPTVSCQRGTLLRWGTAICDGVVDVHACAACTLHGLGLSRFKASVLGALPSTVGRAVARAQLRGGPWTATRMTDLLEHQRNALLAFLALPRQIVVLCEWAAEVLRRNGVPTSKLTLSRHGLSSRQRPRSQQFRANNATGPLQVAFLGRFHHTKGVDTLINAVRSCPEADLELHLFGVSQDDEAVRYARELQVLAAGDTRIQFHRPVPAETVVETLVKFDLLAVPSRWLETGPLVVLEAFDAGVPVVGSRLGGIAELVKPGVDGVLVEPEAVAQWAHVLASLAADRSIVHALRAGITPPRRMSAVADDMELVYERCR
jgi:glycosyltransferase involved in cell wall biosynthesis